DGVALLGHAAQVRGARLLRLGVGSAELLDLGAQLVALFGGRPYDGEPLKHASELLLKPVALRGELAQLAGVPLLLLGQPALLLRGRGLGLGKGGLQRLELVHRALVLFAQPLELAFAFVLYFGEGRPELLELVRRVLV